MTANRVGGDESNIHYFGLFLAGVILGSAIRVVAYIFPSRIVRKLEDLLIGDQR